MTKPKKKSSTSDSEIDREYKSLMADQKSLIADHRRVLYKIERMVDEQAKKHGISFVKDQ